MAVEPFKIQVPDSVLDDLKSRLERTRWPEELPGTDWDYGSNLGYVKELVEYWRTKFDWRGQENLINSFSHFKTDVDGLGIHFIHEKGKGPSPMPPVITHRWPGTFFEMHKMIPSSSQRRGGSWCERAWSGSYTKSSCPPRETATPWKTAGASAGRWRPGSSKQAWTRLS